MQTVAGRRYRTRMLPPYQCRWQFSLAHPKQAATLVFLFELCVDAIFTIDPLMMMMITYTCVCVCVCVCVFVLFTMVRRITHWIHDYHPRKISELIETDLWVRPIIFTHHTFPCSKRTVTTPIHLSRVRTNVLPGGRQGR